MQPAWVWAGASALMGGIVGASLGITLTRTEAPAAEVVLQTRAGELDVLESKLVARLDTLERSVRELEQRRAAVRPLALAPPTGEPAPSTGDQEPMPAPVDDPVFEAAVLDILERAEEGRDSERDARREERARQRSEYWANELGMRLALSPAQVATALEIRSKLATDLREQRQRPPEGTFVPREQRRAAARALRESAEQRLREVLDHRQVAEYEKLAPKLTLSGSDD